MVRPETFGPYYVVLFISEFVKLVSVLIMDKYTVCRYLATGDSFISLHYEYLLGAIAERVIFIDT